MTRLDSLGVTWLMIEANTGFLPVRDRGHLHRHVVGFERDIAVALAERRLGLELLRIDQALDHDLGVGRHVEVDGDAFHHRHRPAGEPAGTPSSSRSTSSFCAPVNSTTGAAPTTIAIGIGSLRLLYFSQCR